MLLSIFFPVENMSLIVWIEAYPSSFCVGFWCSQKRPSLGYIILTWLPTADLQPSQIGPAEIFVRNAYACSDEQKIF